MKEKINCLEGIRAIGCISVFLCHFRGAFLPNQTIWLIDHMPLICMYQINDAVKMTRVIYAAGLVMLFIGVLNCSCAKKLLGNRLMCQGGKLSYAVYLLHWPVIESFSSAYYLWMKKSGAGYRWTILSCLILTFVLVLVMAYFFNRYVENMGHGAISYIEDRLHIQRGNKKTWDTVQNEKHVLSSD